MARYTACAPSWDTPRSKTLEWLILYLFVIDMFLQWMTSVPVIGYVCWLAGLCDGLLLFVLLVMLLKVR